MKVLLIEDHPIVRAGCMRVLQARPDLQVEGAKTGAEGVEKASDADLVILDLNLPDMRGLDVLQAIRAYGPERPVIVFSMYEDTALVSRALEAGAAAYVTKNDDPDCLLQAIDAVREDRRYLSPTVAHKLALSALSGASRPKLTPREQQLFELLGAGRTLAEIASELDVSYRTAAALAARARTRLGLRSNAALIKLAVEEQAG